MKVLIIGSGGREHALAWKMSQSEHVTKVFLAPGNGGSDSEPKIENIDVTGHNELIKFAQINSIDLTVVGPEQPLSEGIVDKFEAHHLKIFGVLGGMTFRPKSPYLSHVMLPIMPGRSGFKEIRMVLMAIDL